VSDIDTDVTPEDRGVYAKVPVVVNEWIVYPPE